MSLTKTNTNKKQRNIPKQIVGQALCLQAFPLIKTQTAQCAPAVWFDHNLTWLIVLTAGKLDAYSSTSKLNLDIPFKRKKADKIIKQNCFCKWRVVMFKV